MLIVFSTASDIALETAKIADFTHPTVINPLDVMHELSEVKNDLYIAKSTDFGLSFAIDSTGLSPFRRKQLSRLW